MVLMDTILKKGTSYCKLEYRRKNELLISGNFSKESSFSFILYEEIA